MQKSQTGLLSHTHIKINSIWIKDLNVKPETTKLLEENIGSMLFDMGPSSIFFFFGYLSSDKGNKSKHKQMGLHQTKKLLHSEENYQQNEKATP